MEPSTITDNVATGINNGGQIVGTYVEQTNQGSTHQGFIYSGGGYTALSVPGAFSTEPFGINDAGQVVGNYGVGSTSQNGFGFTYSGGNFTTLSVPGALAPIDL